MKLYRFASITLLALVMVLGVSQGVSAQTVSGSLGNINPGGPMIPACYTFNTDIRYGSSETSTNPFITQLQDYLVNQGYFDSAFVGTGHFGPLTLSAVKRFQTAHSLPSTGFVGPLTRAVINANCGTTTPPVTTTAPVIYSVSPSLAAVGSTVQIRGFGFSNSNTILMGGGVVARDVPITSSMAIACTTSPTCHGGINQTLTFTVPSAIGPNCAPNMACPMYMRLVTPGEYDITVEDDNGTSNVIPFTVTTGGSTTNQTISISGLDSPASLSVGQTGSWTVHAIPASNSGNLHYSVSWGDAIASANSAQSIAIPVPVQNSATFTHAYQQTGTYTAVFTVTDDAGHSANASNTVTVTPVY